MNNNVNALVATCEIESDGINSIDATANREAQDLHPKFEPLKILETFLNIKSKGNKEAPLDLENKIVILSPQVFAWNIWKFKIHQNNTAIIDGIYREGIFELLTRKCFFKRYSSDQSYIFINDQNNKISNVEISVIRDELTDYVKNISGLVKFQFRALEVEITAEKLHEVFYTNSHLIFNQNSLGHLQNHTKPILRDKKKEMFFPFENCIVQVTADKVQVIEYENLQNVCVWRDHIINRNFESTDMELFCKSYFANFIDNVANNEPDRIAAFKSAIGYLLHNYGHQSKGRAVIGYDEEITDNSKPEGGTGKGIFAQALRQLRQSATIDGKKFDPSAVFAFQNINDRTQIVYFDDVKQSFDFLRFNSILTEGWEIEPKNKPSFRIEPENSPKVYITSNAIIKGEGTTIERRQFILEFSPFYSRIARLKKEPIIETHGCMFFDNDEWTPNDWNNLFSYMLDCAKYYLKNGLQYYELRTVNENKVLQSTDSDFAEWIKTKGIEPKMEFSILEFFTEFKSLYYGDESTFKQRPFTNWLKIYAIAKGFELKIRTSNGNRIGEFRIKQ